MRLMNKRFHLTWPCSFIVAAMWTCGAIAQTTSPGSGQAYPAKPIRFVLGFSAGGSSDILARLIGQKLSEALGQPVVIDNRPGAGGNIAAEIVAKSPADGYTLLLGNQGILATNVSLYSKLAFDPVNDFSPVVLLASQPNISACSLPGIPAATSPAAIWGIICTGRAPAGELNYPAPGHDF